MTNALKFTFDTTDVLFTTKEVRRVDITHIQKEDEYWDQSGYFERQLIGKTYKRLNVIIRQDDADTFGKIKDLFDAIDTYKQPKNFTVYYRLTIDSDTITARMNRSKFEKLYLKHSRSARDIELEFIETE